MIGLYKLNELSNCFSVPNILIINEFNVQNWL